MKNSLENNIYLLEQIFTELELGIHHCNKEMSPPPQLLKGKDLLGKYIYKCKAPKDIDCFTTILNRPFVNRLKEAVS